MWAEERNTNDQEFPIIIDKLKSLFPHHAIMVVSDSMGCSYFKAVAQKAGINLLYSKDYSPTFLGDGALLLGGEYHFELRGGGIGVFALFSNLPYEFIIPLVHEIEWREGKVTSWATEEQNIRKIAYADKQIYLPVGLRHKISEK